MKITVHNIYILHAHKHNCNKTKIHYRGDKNTQRDKTKKNKLQDKNKTQRVQK